MSWAGPLRTSVDGFIVNAMDRIIFNNCTYEHLFRLKYIYTTVYRIQYLTGVHNGEGRSYS